MGSAFIISLFPKMKSFQAKPAEQEPKWYVIDANGQTLGRMSVKIANILRGKHRPTYTPNVDTGGYVIVINAEKVVLTGKKEYQKQYMFFSGWRGNEKYKSASEMRDKRPTFLLENSIRGMMPKTKLGDAMFKKLKVYAGPEHPHEAQQPEPLSA